MVPEMLGETSKYPEAPATFAWTIFSGVLALAKSASGSQSTEYPAAEQVHRQTSLQTRTCVVPKERYAFRKRVYTSVPKLFSLGACMLN